MFVLDDLECLLYISARGFFNVRFSYLCYSLNIPVFASMTLADFVYPGFSLWFSYFQRHLNYLAFLSFD
jgi:hypothetical protein